MLLKTQIAGKPHSLADTHLKIGVVVWDRLGGRQLPQRGQVLHAHRHDGACLHLRGVQKKMRASSQLERASNEAAARGVLTTTTTTTTKTRYDELREGLGIGSPSQLARSSGRTFRGDHGAALREARESGLTTDRGRSSASTALSDSRT